MALDSNHVTKLGELKQLIDGLWGKVTTAISNAVSGLLSKSEAAETYATKGEIPTTDNFATKDGSNATGTWGIDVSGNARRLNTQTITSSSTAVYGAYVGDLISNSFTSFSEATLFVEISLSSAYMSMQYMLHIERRGAEEFSASLVEIGNRQYGFPNDVSCKIAYKRESDYSSSSNGLSKWYIILIDNNGNEITKNFVRFSFARIFIHNVLFEPKFEFLTSVPSTTSYYQARFAPQTYITAKKGSSTKPVFIAESGLVTACSFGLSFVSSLPSYANMEDSVLYVM